MSDFNKVDFFNSLLYILRQEFVRLILIASVTLKYVLSFSPQFFDPDDASQKNSYFLPRI